MSPRAARSIALGLLLLAGAGCGEVVPLSRRYKAERLLWWAQRAEAAARLRSERPDSTTLLALRESYRRIAREVPPPYIEGRSESARERGREVMRAAAGARIQAARLAAQANRPDLALQELDEVATLAAGDTLTLRRADLLRLATLRQFKRDTEAIALMREMLRRYPPMPPRSPDEEDPILSIPEGIVRLYRERGEKEEADKGLAEAASYYRGLLKRRHPPALEAQIRARLVRIELEQQDWSAGLRDLEVLRDLASATPSLAELEPEIRYSEAKLHAIRDREKDPSSAIAMLDRVAQDFPTSRYAARAVFEAGVLLEQHGRRKEALERYRAAATKYGKDLEVAPIAIYRRAMLEEQQGDWERAKNLLESIPVEYPESQAAVEAPLAVVSRYLRVGQRDAAKQALRKAINTYDGLIARDTTYTAVPVYRWSKVSCYMALGEWAAALDVVDEMARKDVWHPFAAQALLEGARLAHQHGQDGRARRYLEAFVANYPNSPVLGDVREQLSRLGAGRGKAG